MARLIFALLAAALSLVAAPSAPGQDEPARRDFTGTVSDEAGNPVPLATVHIWQAWPVRGVAYYCPGCYADCGKTARADDDGRYAISSVDASLQDRKSTRLNS